jgi:hypothetical protein
MGYPRVVRLGLCGQNLAGFRVNLIGSDLPIGLG